jgi:hypothetical protein
MPKHGRHVSRHPLYKDIMIKFLAETQPRMSKFEYIAQECEQANRSTLLILQSPDVTDNAILTWPAVSPCMELPSTC